MVKRAHLFPSSGAGPSTGTSGATADTGSGTTGDPAAPHPARHSVSCADETAYTIRPRPIQACAAEHIGQCSPDV